MKLVSVRGKTITLDLTKEDRSRMFQCGLQLVVDWIVGPKKLIVVPYDKTLNVTKRVEISDKFHKACMSECFNDWFRDWLNNWAESHPVGKNKKPAKKLERKIQPETIKLAAKDFAGMLPVKNGKDETNTQTVRKKISKKKVSGDDPNQL